MGIEVDVGAVLLKLVLELHVQQLHHVRHEVRQLLVELDLLGVLLDLLLLRLLLVVEAHHLVLDDLDLVFEHPCPLRNLVRIGPRNLLPQVVVSIPSVAKDVNVHRRSGRGLPGASVA